MSKIENNSKLENIVLGGGCFWCLEAVFNRVRGVVSVVSGYAGGKFPIDGKPTYEQVSSGKTGHAEVVCVTYDKTLISLEDVLHIFFSIHDPTTLNRQGSDVGTQYRSVILYANEFQHEIVDKILREVANEDFFAGNMIVTEVKKLEVFYPAESYHQQYFEKNPDNAYCQLVVAPKVGKFREKYGNFFK